VHAGHAGQAVMVAVMDAPSASRVAFSKLGKHYLQAGRWDVAGITAAHVDTAEQWALSSSKWTVAGGWRAKWQNGSLWVRMLSMQPHWAERASVLHMLLAATSQQPQLPPFDVVYVHNDRDPAPGLARSPRRRWPVLTNAHESGHASLPVPDYSFAGWHTHTPPWCELQMRMDDAAAHAGPWENRTDLAFFSGNLRIGGHRKYLRRLTVENRTQVAGVLRVQDVGSTFYVPSRAAGARAATAPAVPPMSAACHYRYLISVPGYGYSNRLKALLSCGSVVIHVKAPWEEYFMPMLQHNRHLVVVASVDEIVPAVLRLRANPQLARQIGRKGAKAAHSFVSFGQALDFTRQLLTAYREASEPTAPPDSNYSRLASASDLGRIVQLCDCSTARNKTGAAKTKPPIRQPSRARCASQLGVDGPPRSSYERLSAVRCCEGWDCPKPMCQREERALDRTAVRRPLSRGDAS
jgi:hypothetical protein